MLNIEPVTGSIRNLFHRDANPDYPIRYNELRYLPMLVGAISPLSTIMTIPPLVGPWKGTNLLEDYKVYKPIVYTSLMIVAIGCLLSANACLLLRFQEKRIVLMTWLAVLFYILHASFMFGPILNFAINEPPSGDYNFTGDYLAGVAVIIISYISASLLLIDYYRHGQLHQRGSGISHQQRNLVFFCIFVALWSSVGAVVFSYFEGWSFTRGVYFTLVTMTTIGFGDYVPKLTGTRIFLFFYATIGIVAMGMFINAIRKVILEHFETIYFQKLDQLKHSKLETFFTLDRRNNSTQENSEVPTKEQTLINEREILLFGGAGIFLLVEPDWTYFDSIYFCFVSFTTIGYGDVTLTTFYGIVIFIGYSLCGLVAATYVISIATEIWSLRLIKRQVHIEKKRRLKTARIDHNDPTSLEIISSPETFDFDDRDQLLALLDQTRKYHQQVHLHLSQCDTYLYNCNKVDIHELAHQHRSLGALLNAYPPDNLISPFTSPA